MKLRWIVTASSMLLASTAFGAHADPSANTILAADPQDAALAASERAAKTAEAWEMKGASAFSEGQDYAPDLEKARQSVSAYLGTHPNEVRALLLQARILRALIIVSPVTIKLEDKGGRVTGGDMSKERSDALVALEKAAQLDPQNADAYYWKARVLSLSNPAAEQVGAEKEFDPTPGIDAARKAVSLAPANSTYREYLALTLIGSGQAVEGLQELEKLPTKHPLLQLVDDMDVVPAPDGAEPDNDRGYDLASTLFSGRMDVFRYPGFRARAYSVSNSSAELQAFYARKWPGIHWVKKGKDPSAFAALLWREDKLEPIADPAPFSGDFGKQLPPSGVLIVVTRDPETKPVRTRLFIVDFRRF